MRLSAQSLANAERLNPFNEISLLLKFVKEYNEITFDNFYELKYNFVCNILFYEKVKAEYEEDFTNEYRKLKEQQNKSKK